ncbi:hypothetical protein [Stakelama saccharophila]|uniref:Bacterial dipeptidyl-peptidase SH3 domain-containing protein n=1 Tax=Stakelama saccharophila TaxID=3075605 RepID=A0ABZ0B5K2_9SPHN|nr:hypothetical protein [Stakelama sp. W311]WNO52456.1 hypothetical protein RPR59_08170 [Stakelama sp. W311]
MRFGIRARHPLRSGPAETAPRISEILAGENFDALEISGKWAWGISAVDGCVGYIERAVLADPVEADHVVAVRSARFYASPVLAGAPAAELPMGSRVRVEGGTDVCRTPLGHGRASDLLPADVSDADWAVTAEALIGASYVDGGRSGAGVDAGGLIFLGLQLAGIAAPRFVDLQSELLGFELDPDAAVRRGDLIFGDGAAAIMTDDQHCATADMAAGEVVRVPLSEFTSGIRGAVIRRRIES